MGALDDAVQQAQLKQQADRQAQVTEEAAYNTAIHEFVEKVQSQGIPPRPIWRLTSHVKKGLFGSKTVEAAEFIDSGWLVGYSTDDGYEYMYLKVVLADGRVMGSEYIYQAKPADPKRRRAKLRSFPVADLDLTPGATGPLLSNRWQPTRIGVSRATLQYLAEYLLAAASQRPISLFPTRS